MPDFINGAVVLCVGHSESYAFAIQDCRTPWQLSHSGRELGPSEPD